MLWTIPAMDGGLHVASKLFRQESWEKLLTLAGGTRLAGSGWKQHGNQSVSDHHLEAQVQGLRDTELFRLRADATGTIVSAWSQPRGSSDALKTLVNVSLPLHKAFYMDILDFHGSVVITGRNAWERDPQEGPGAEAISVTHPALVQVDGLDVGGLEDALGRAIDRSRGRWRPEP